MGLSLGFKFSKPEILVWFSLNLEIRPNRTVLNSSLDGDFVFESCHPNLFNLNFDMVIASIDYDCCYQS